jgi:hypothetical protein
MMAAVVMEVTKAIKAARIRAAVVGHLIIPATRTVKALVGLTKECQVGGAVLR